MSSIKMKSYGSKDTISFDILDNGKRDKSLIVPSEYDGIKVKSIHDIDEDIAFELEEIEFPDCLKYVDSIVLEKLKNVKKIVFNRDVHMELNGKRKLFHLKEIEIRKLSINSTGKYLRMTLSDLCNLEKVTIVEKPMSYPIYFISSCPKLDISNLLYEGLKSLCRYCFVNITNTEVNLPKSLLSFYTNSFTSIYGEITINVKNDSTYLKYGDMEVYRDSTLVHGLKIFKHLEGLDNIIIADKYEKKKGLTIVKEALTGKDINKINKARILGTDIIINGINKEVERIKMSLLLTENDTIKNAINNSIENAANDNAYSFNLISNGYTSIQFETIAVAKLKELNTKLDIMNTSNYTIVKNNKMLHVYCLNKEYIINNVESYYDEEYKIISIQPIKKIVNFLDIESVKDTGNKLIITFKDGRKEEVTFNG